MGAKDRQNKTESPKVEVGEIDTSSPFRSVKDAVNHFGEGAFSGERITIKKIKPHSAERVLVKETRLHLAQKEIYKLKEQLKIAETTKAGAIVELERSKRTVDDLTKKLKVTNEAKEAAKNQVKQFESREINLNGERKQDLENMKQQYVAMFTELDTAKQELKRIHHDHETSIEERNDAIKQEIESELLKKVNLDRAGEISKEMMSVQGTIEQMKLAKMKAQQEKDKVLAEKSVQKLAHKAALEESAKKLFALRERVDQEMSKDLETQFSETTSKIKRLQTETENARASDLGSLKPVTLDLDGAKCSLQKVVEEESSLKKLLASLKIELENIKKEHKELKEKEKEAETESVVGNLNSKLQKSKIELESEGIEEAKVTGASDEMMLTFQQLISENENAKREFEEMKEKAEELKKEADAMAIALEETENQLKIALTEADEAKKAESKALDDLKVISERTDASRASTSESGSKIMISREEFEALSRKVVDSEKLVEMKVEAAKAQVEATRASEKQAVKKLEAAHKEIVDLKAATEVALKMAEAAERYRKAVEGELKRWQERELKTVALILQETQMQQTPSFPSPPNYQQSPPQKQKTKKLLSGISMFHRKKSQVDAGSSPSYLPGEMPV
ncbi:hypothetical protein SSX86_005954 [Deinandra increscens subsp. villosa]|uniref:Paramyosin n=1 Tax=Deinandra increscens subsp. villosa TaxID=3103831 RepID=A0AAP0DRG3_9ASTR